MIIVCPAVQDGIFADKYGKRGTQFKASMPTFSFGFRLQDIPLGTVSFAFVLAIYFLAIRFFISLMFLIK